MIGGAIGDSKHADLARWAPCRVSLQKRFMPEHVAVLHVVERHVQVCALLLPHHLVSHGGGSSKSDVYEITPMGREECAEPVTMKRGLSFFDE